MNLGKIFKILKIRYALSSNYLDERMALNFQNAEENILDRNDSCFKGVLLFGNSSFHDEKAQES